MKFRIADERGMAMITVLGILLMVGLLGISMVATSNQEMNISDNFKRDTQALYAAEAGSEFAYSQFQAAIKATNKPPDPLPDGTFDFNGHTVTYHVEKVGGPVDRTLSSGTYRGLRALVNDYDIWGHAASTATAVQNSVRVRMEQALIPIFQFAIFYEDDLEWHPGPVMTLSGRVHSNSDLYLGSHNGLTIRSFVTAANEIRHGRHPASGESAGGGHVSIEDPQGVAQNMRNANGTWLDHSDPDWLTKSTQRWGGQVQDVDHGITRLEVPLETGGGPISIIKGAPGGNVDSYERKATLKFVDGSAYHLVGATWVDVTAAMIADGSITTGSFYDGREGKTVTTLDIDVSNLNNSPYWPDNGIVYSRSAVGTFPATRLLNGAELKDALTVASENPIYTKGSYNTTNKKPAAIMTDAYTILSGNWDDAKSTLSLGNRNATNTTVNVSFISGNVPSASGNYSGGVENFPRFLENWSSRTLTWKGSMVQLWRSEQATQRWSYGGYYTAPDRVWDFDNDLLDPSNLPPGTPVVNVVIKKGWFNTGGPITAGP